MRITARDPKSVLVFSGGQTRRDAGPRSEGQSYWHVAEHFDWWGTGAGARATTEEYARDSLENVLFAACRFQEVVGRYPKRVTVVSYDFKRRRFVELLGPALHLPLEFVGVAIFVGAYALAVLAARAYKDRPDASRRATMVKSG